MRTSMSNMMRLRSGLIGSMSAWLPSRRSTAHQRGAVVMRFDGQVRSGRSTANCSWYGRYRCTGIGDGCWVFFMGVLFSLYGWVSADDELRSEGGLELGLAAAAKEK